MFSSERNAGLNLGFYQVKRFDHLFQAYSPSLFLVHEINHEIGECRCDSTIPEKKSKIATKLTPLE